MTNGLTKTEREILIGCCNGLTYKEIACLRSVNVDSVKNQARVIFQKLGARNKVAAIVVAIRKGIISVGLNEG